MKWRAEYRTSATGARIVEHRLPVAVEEAEVDMGTVADAVGSGMGAKLTRVAQAEGDCLRQLARDHRFVSGAHARAPARW